MKSSLLFISAALVACHTGQRFDEVQWKQQQIGPGIEARLPMVADLVENHELKALTKEQVHALLGPPMPFETAPRGEDWYVVNELYQNGGTDQFEMPSLQECLVIKYSGERVAELELCSAKDDAKSAKKVTETCRKL